MAIVSFKSVAPILNVNSRTMNPTIELFVDQLGFELDTVLGKHPTFAMVKKDGLTIMLFCRSIIPWPHKGWAIYIWVNNVDDLFAELQERQTPIKTAPHNREYGVRELEVSLPDGRQIVFGQQLQS